ncbi:MAG: hypothetical protein WC514_03250 [Candidatus Paceibacterota bacterium]
MDWIIWTIVVIVGMLAYLGIGRSIAILLKGWVEEYELYGEEKWAWFNLFFWPVTASAILLLIAVIIALAGIGIALILVMVTVIIFILIVALLFFLAITAAIILPSLFSGGMAIKELAGKSPPYFSKGGKRD